MTKVLQLRSSGNFLGAERVVIELSKRLPSLGFEPIVGIPLEVGAEVPELYHVAKDLGIQAELFYCKHPYDLSIISTVRKFVIEQEVDVVHSHGYREDLYALGCRKHAAIIATNHLWKRTSWKLKLYAALDAWWLKKFQTVIAVSQPILNEMRAANIAPEKTFLVANGIDIERYAEAGDRNALRESLGISPDAMVLITVSSLTQEKGLHFALPALAQSAAAVSKLHLLIIGDGEESDQLRQQASKLGVSGQVTFAGRRSDIAELLNCADIFLLPSLMEGLPMAMLEAMAAGKAVIASDVGDVASALHSDAGILIKAGAVDQLAAAIQRLAGDRDLLNRMGKRAREIVLEKFSSAHMANEYARHYQALLVARREVSYQ